MAQVAFNDADFDVINKNVVAPPTPQMSEDDLLSGLQVMDKHASAMCEPLQAAMSPTMSASEAEEEESASDLDDIVLMMYIEFMDLIYWEIPGRSGIVLTGILASLEATRHYSLLYIIAGALTILTGFNLIFVNAYNLIRSAWTGLPTEEFLHPYHLHIHQDSVHSMPRELTEYYVHKIVDVLETLSQKLAKIVLVEDTKTTAVSCAFAVFIYFATNLIPTKVFFGLIVIAVFTIPYLYEQYQDVVDEKLQTVQQKTKEYMTKHSTIIFEQLEDYMDQLSMLKLLVGEMIQENIGKLKTEKKTSLADSVAEE